MRARSIRTPHAPMMAAAVGATLLALVLATQPLTAGEVYKCPTASGKVEYRDTPCEKSAGQKVDVRPNSIDTRPNPDAVAKEKVLDAEIAKRIQSDREFRAREAAANAAHYNYCQQYREQIVRQQAWLYSESVAVRQSAVAEIEIARQRLRAGGC